MIVTYFFVLNIFLLFSLFLLNFSITNILIISNIALFASFVAIEFIKKQKNFNKGIKNVLVTLGTKGSLLINKNELIKVDAFKVDAIDTVAAGDTFVGYFVSALASGKSEKEAMLLASKASSITVSRKGSLVSIPTLKEIYEKYSD